jgi:hypothetical protein
MLQILLQNGARLGSHDPKKVYESTQRLSGQLADWLRASAHVPQQLAPNHAFRHRFKSVGRELGIDERILAAICGHNGKTVDEKCGDVNFKTRIEAIDKFPYYAVD